MMSKLFIQYYNVFAEEQSKYHLSVEELYLYGLLSILKNKENLTITNIDILQQYSPIKFFSREKEAKKRIKECLLSLKDKGVINFDVKELKNNTLLNISFITNLNDESIGKSVSGFEKVEIDKFNSFTSMIDNYIYFTVKRFNNLGGFKCDYERWSYILNVTEKTARRKIDQAVKNKVIYKNIGDYKEEMVTNRSQKKQEKNIYKTIPFAEDEKTIQTKKAESNEANEKRKEQLENVDNLDDYEKEINEAMYFFTTFKDEDGDVFPESHHYALYLEVKENIEERQPTELEASFIKAAERRMGYLKHNQKFKDEFAVGEEMFRENKRNQNSTEIDDSKLDLMNELINEEVNRQREIRHPDKLF